MNNKFAHLFLTLICIISLFTTAGCIPLMLGAAAGAGGVVYVKGNLEKNFDYPVADVHQASLDALKDLGLIITNDDITRHNATIDAQFDDGKKLKITITALTEKACNIKVRAGIVGDEIRAQSVMTAIENQL